MPSTTNFGWTTPADTDLVKDGAAAIRTLGNGVDASFVDLKGGTTGQILSKASNTDLDFTWIANDQGDITAVTAGTGLTGGGTTGAVTLTNDMATTITASGDIVVGTGSGTYDNLPIGTTGQVLTADTTVSPYKVKWASPASGGGLTLISTVDASAATSVSFTSISQSYKALCVTWTDVFFDSSTNTLRMGVRLNNNSGAVYSYRGVGLNPSLVVVDTRGGSIFGDAVQNSPILPNKGATDIEYNNSGVLWIYDYTNGSKSKIVQWTTGSTNIGNSPVYNTCTGLFGSNTAITQIDFVRNSTQAVTGQFKLWGLS